MVIPWFLNLVLYWCTFNIFLVICYYKQCCIELPCTYTIAKVKASIILKICLTLKLLGFCTTLTQHYAVTVLFQRMTLPNSSQLYEKALCFHPCASQPEVYRLLNTSEVHKPSVSSGDFFWELCLHSHDPNDRVWRTGIINSEHMWKVFFAYWFMVIVFWEVIQRVKVPGASGKPFLKWDNDLTPAKTVCTPVSWAIISPHHAWHVALIVFVCHNFCRAGN